MALCVNTNHATTIRATTNIEMTTCSKFTCALLNSFSVKSHCSPISEGDLEIWARSARAEYLNSHTDCQPAFCDKQIAKTHPIRIRVIFADLVVAKCLSKVINRQLIMPADYDKLIRNIVSVLQESTYTIFFCKKTLSISDVGKLVYLPTSTKPSFL